MPTRQIEIVTDFLSRWDKPGGFADAVHAYFTPETVWENVGMSRTVGPDDAALLFANLGGGGAPLTMRVDNLAVAVTGNKVLTERIDHVLAPDGSIALSLPVMGTFELKDGKILAWRDYFDTAGFGSQGKD